MRSRMTGATSNRCPQVAASATPLARLLGDKWARACGGGGGTSRLRVVGADSSKHTIPVLYLVVPSNRRNGMAGCDDGGRSSRGS